MIKIDSALLLDTFNEFSKTIYPFIFIYLKLNSYRDFNNINLVNINYLYISKRFNISKDLAKKAVKYLIKKNFLIKKENNTYFILDEFEYFNKLRTLKREKFYTRGVVFRIRKKFFYKLLRVLNYNFLAIKLYYFLIIISQHDLWTTIKQLRCQTKITKIIKYARVWVQEDKFYEILKSLINIGLIKVDQKKKIHTLIDFVV